ncbi:MAG: WYL domain-containing protein [Blautia sp.]|nr:WYL domain-containing protein [Blautia sp.]
MNESIYYNIDVIHSAINSDRKIRFQYFNWSVDKKQELRHGGEYYSVSPWGVCWNDEWYYLIAFDDKSQEIRHYRVDKMKKLTLTGIIIDRFGRDIPFSKVDEEHFKVTVNVAVSGLFLDGLLA